MKPVYLFPLLSLIITPAWLSGEWPTKTSADYNRLFTRKGGDIVKNPGAGALQLSFKDALRLASEKPASVIMSHERVQQAVARLGESRSSLLPQLTATASETHQTRNLAAQGITIPGMNPLVGPFQTFDARIKLTQALFDAETLGSLRLAEAGRDLALQQKRKSREDAMALVATLYVEAKRAQDGVALGEVLKQRDEKELALSRSQLRLGTGSQTAVDEAEAHLADSQRFLTAARAQSEERRLDLAAALDLAVDRPVVFMDNPRLPPPPSAKEIASMDLESHPDVAVARGALAERRARAGVVKAGYAPKISASADYGQSGALPSDSLGTYAFGGQFSVPVFEGGSRQKRVQEARRQVQESEVQLKDVRIQTQARARSASESVRKSWATVQARESALRVADKELALAGERLRLGVGTDLEWIEQKAREAQAKDDWEEAVATYQIARVSLAQALGKMEQLAK